MHYRKENGLPRRFAPRNDMQKLAACPHNTWALPGCCRKASLQPLTPARLQHVIANNVLATADTRQISACHCEPVRTLVWQSASPQKCLASWQLFGQTRYALRICPKYCFPLCATARRSGLSRRSAPRNDSGGDVTAPQCPAPADTWHVFAHLARQTFLHPQTRYRLQHVIANQCAHWCGNPFSPQRSLASGLLFGQIRDAFPYSH